MMSPAGLVGQGQASPPPQDGGAVCFRSVLLRPLSLGGGGGDGSENGAFEPSVAASSCSARGAILTARLGHSDSTTQADQQTDLLLATHDGRLSILRAHLPQRALCVLGGFGRAVGLVHAALPSVNNATGAPPPAMHWRLLLVNAEGDLFVLEFDRSRLDAAASEIETSGPGATGSTPTDPYESSTFLRSHRRLRVPLNVSTMEWSTGCVSSSSSSSDLSSTLDWSSAAASVGEDAEDARPQLMLATIDRSLHIYELSLERDAEELAAEVRELARLRALEGRGRSLISSPSFAPGRRPSFNSSTLSGLQGLGAPMLSNHASPALKPRMPSSTASPLIGSSKSPLIQPQPQNLQQSSMSSTRTSSPITIVGGLPAGLGSGSILGLINNGSSPGGGTAASSLSTSTSISASPRIESATPTPVTGGGTASPVLFGSSTPRGSEREAPRVPPHTLHCRLELKHQLLQVPLAIHALSCITSSGARMVELLRDPSAPSTSPSASLVLPSNSSSLLAMRPDPSDARTWHVLPSALFQRASTHATGKSSVIHQRAPSHGGNTNQQLPNNTTLANATHHASLKDIHAVAASPLSRSVGRGGAGGGGGGPGGASAFAVMLAANSAASSRKNSGAQYTSSASPAFPPQPHLQQPSTSFGGLGPSMLAAAPPTLGGMTSSPRFSFMNSVSNFPSSSLNNAAPIGTAGTSMLLNSNSVSASPAMFGTTVPAIPGGFSSFSLGSAAAGVSNDQATTDVPVTMLSISSRLIVVSLEEGVLLVDPRHKWTMLLSFPGARGRKHGGGALLRNSSSLASLATSAGGPSTSPPATNTSLFTGARNHAQIGSPPRGSAASIAAASGISILHSFAQQPFPHASPAPQHQQPSTAGGMPSMMRTLSAPGMSHLDVVGSAPQQTGFTSGHEQHPPPPPQSNSSTPVLRPSSSHMRRQPSGIDLLALNESLPSVARSGTLAGALGGDLSPTASSTSPLKINLALSTSTICLTGHIGDTPLASPSASGTPLHSMANSRNPSYGGGLGGLGCGPQGSQQSGGGGQQGSQTPLMSPLGGSTTSSQSGADGGGGGGVGEMIKALVIGDLALVDAGRATQSSGSGVLAVLDSLGRFSVQHICAQFATAPASSPAVTYAFNLPGLFLGMATVPLTTADESEAGAAEQLLVACSLDGTVYFIPTLPQQPRSNNVADEGHTSSAASAATLPSPLTITRFSLAARVQSFHAGLLVVSPGQPAEPCLFIVTFQGELLFFPRIVLETGVTQWKHEWIATTPGSASTATSTTSTITSEMSRTGSLENLLASSPEGGPTSEPTAAGGPKIVLVPHSSRRNVLDTWLQSDLASGEQAEATSVSSLCRWASVEGENTTKSPSHSEEGAPTTIATAPSSPTVVASAVQALRAVDATLLRAYRASLLQQLAHAEGRTARSNSIVQA